MSLFFNTTNTHHKLTKIKVKNKKIYNPKNLTMLQLYIYLHMGSIVLVCRPVPYCPTIPLPSIRPTKLLFSSAN